MQPYGWNHGAQDNRVFFAGGFSFDCFVTIGGRSDLLYVGFYFRFIHNNKNFMKSFIKKGITALTILLLAIPAGLVEAQEETSESSSGSSTETVLTEPIAEIVETDTTNSEDTTDTDPVADEADPTDIEAIEDVIPEAGLASEEDPLPTYENTTRQEIDQRSATDFVNTQTGALTYEYPIVVPESPRGLTPRHNLYSHSQRADTIGVFGFGWSIDIPYIERENREGVEYLYDSSSPYFFSSVSGELVEVASGTYRAKVRSGEHLYYEFTNDTWVMIDKQGVTYTFGATTTSRRDNSDDLGEIHTWYLEKVEDLNGNTITYSYFRDENQIYPASIGYSDIYEVVFVREAATNLAVSYAPGFRVETNYRVSGIDALVEGSRSTSYSLDATDDVVREIAHAAYRNGVIETEQVRRFESEAVESSTFELDGTWSLSSFGGDDYAQFADLNGDGLPDRVIHHRNPVMASEWDTYVHLNTGAGWERVEDRWEDFLTSDTGESYELTNADDAVGTRLADINGDGLADFVGDARRVYLNTGSTFELDSSWNLASFSDDDHAQFADLNGDGLPDRIIHHHDPQMASEWDTFVHLNTGDGWEQVYDRWEDFLTSDTGESYPLTHDEDAVGGRLADINGDGLTDFVGDARQVYLNTGSTFELDGTWSLSSFGGDDYAQFADLNGDGLPDRVIHHRNPVMASEWDTYVHLNTGAGWERVEDRWEDFLTSDTGESYELTNADDAVGTRLADINGDGLADFVGDARKAYVNTGPSECPSSHNLEQLSV